MHKIKVLLGSNSSDLQASLRGIFQSQIDIQLVGEVLDPIGILLAVSEYTADVVVLTLKSFDQDIGICSHLISEYPELIVLAFSPDERSVHIFTRRIIREELSKVSGDVILAAIRGARDNLD